MWTGLVVAALSVGNAFGADRRARETISPDLYEGRALFLKRWVPGERSPAGGDGLGPYYNEVSCVACHFQGGNGGAGPNSKNVTLLSAFATVRTLPADGKVYQAELVDLHSGFAKRETVVVHDHSTESDYEHSRRELLLSLPLVQTRDELVPLSQSQRNTPALFGAGLIEHVSDSVLFALEGRPELSRRFPEIQGRLMRLRDGRIGRFGWKAQTASLDEFVRGACSNELGLEVPGHHQVMMERVFDPSTLQLDLSEEQCQQMIAYVRQLPAPVVRPTGSGAAVIRGRKVFESIGCAECHRPVLGFLRGAYTDLMLHDMGPELGASGGGYGASSSSSVTPVEIARGPGPGSRSGEATAREWRTPPLWGLRDSAPYLHDGRARTMRDAIALHGGEAEKTRERFQKLSRYDAAALVRFLATLAAPGVDRPELVSQR
jgi:CxxC motif-containing protein (DUF1111 family)